MVAIICIISILVIMSALFCISSCIVGGRKEKEYYEYKSIYVCDNCNKPMKYTVVKSNETYEKLHLYCPTCDVHKEKIVKREGK